MNLELQSERLRLVPFSRDDLDLCLDLFTDPEVVRYTVGRPMSEEAIHEKMSDWLRRGADGWIGIWRISDRETGEKYGTTALLPMPIEERQTDYGQVRPGHVPEASIEIGYMIRRSAWGRGYATEACRRLLKFIFRETPLQEVVATITPGNTASRNVLVKTGFADLGTRYSYGEEGPFFRLSRERWSHFQESP
jgi:RimJ/RimL family protein N-acetyltransferase